jgi:hypothetical protein
MPLRRDWPGRGRIGQMCGVGLAVTSDSGPGLRAVSPTTTPVVFPALLGYLQSILHHPVDEICDIVVFDDERRAKPLRITLGVLVDPFTRLLSERSNEC